MGLTKVRVECKEDCGLEMRRTVASLRKLRMTCAGVCVVGLISGAVTVLTLSLILGVCAARLWTAEGRGSDFNKLPSNISTLSSRRHTHSGNKNNELRFR